MNELCLMLCSGSTTVKAVNLSLWAVGLISVVVVFGIAALIGFIVILREMFGVGENV